MVRSKHNTTPGRLSIVMLLTGIVALAATTANAQRIMYEEGLATGIRNLRVNNLCYDVEFVDGSYLSTFADSPPMFLNRPVAANAAANEIRDVLNSTRRVPEINDSDNEVLWVPNDRVTRSRFQAEQIGHDKSTDPWRRYGDFQGSVAEDYEPWDFAVFEEGPSVVYAANSRHAVGIHNLNIDGTCLDVRFADGSYNDVYDDHNPRYLGLELRANNATNAIMNVLNDQRLVPHINDSDNEVLWVPTDRDRMEFEAEQVGHDTSAAPWRRFGDFRGSTSKDAIAWDFAVFDDSLDCNRDGVVDVNDMNCACSLKDKDMGKAILNAIHSLPGDTDGDGTVAFADFLNLSGNFGEKGNYTDGDLDCNGKVNFADFLIQSGNFGNSGGPVNLPKMLEVASVPEPAGWSLFGMAVPGMLLMSRRRRSEHDVA